MTARTTTITDTTTTATLVSLTLRHLDSIVVSSTEGLNAEKDETTKLALDSLTGGQDALFEENEALRRNLKEINARLDCASSSKDASDTIFQSLLSRVDELATLLGKSQEENASMKQQFEESLKQECIRRKRELSLAIIRVQSRQNSEIDALQAERIENRKQISELTKRMDGLAATLSSVLPLIAELTAENARLKADLTENQRKILLEEDARKQGEAQQRRIAEANAAREAEQRELQRASQEAGLPPEYILAIKALFK